jgi:hypothetical protein
MNKQSREQAASDALLLTAEIVNNIGLAAAYIISTASSAQPARQQLVVTCVGESGVPHSVSVCATAASQSHVAGFWSLFT